MNVLITGASKGIGRETAAAFARNGWNVCVHGRNQEHLESAVGRVREAVAGPDQQVVSVLGDLTRHEECERIVAQAVDHLGGLHALVNNAGIAMRGRFADVSPDVWQRVFAINSLAPALVTRAALPHLQTTQGSVVFVSSAVGLWGFPMVSAYAASKHALNGLAQALRTEVAPQGVHVGIIYVGIVENDADKQILRHDGSSFVPAARGRVLTQERVARAVYRLVRLRRRSRTLSFGAVMTGILVRLAPGLVDFILRKAGRQIERLAK